MPTRLLLVDYENVQAVDLAALPDDVHVLFVLGVKQTKLPAELSIQAHAMGDRFKYVPIKGQQPNAVDFCIAFYLGEFSSRNEGSECIVLSKDKKGFDPLVRHLVEDRGMSVRRVNTLADAFGARSTALVPTGDPYTRVVDLLRKEPARHRPRKRTGLVGKIKSYLPGSNDASRDALLARLFADGKVSESAGKLGYELD
jgi:PIN domain